MKKYKSTGSLEIKGRGIVHFVTSQGAEKVGDKFYLEDLKEVKTIKGIERNALLGEIKEGEKIGLVINQNA